MRNSFDNTICHYLALPILLLTCIFLSTAQKAHTQVITRISQSYALGVSGLNSHFPEIPDYSGRYVFFAGGADILPSGPGSMLYDRVSNTISKFGTNCAEPKFSKDMRYVFCANRNGDGRTRNIDRYDVEKEEHLVIVTIREDNYCRGSFAINSTGTVLAYCSNKTEESEGRFNGDASDVFILDIPSGITEQVPLPPNAPYQRFGGFLCHQNSMDDTGRFLVVGTGGGQGGGVRNGYLFTFDRELNVLRKILPPSPVQDSPYCVMTPDAKFVGFRTTTAATLFNREAGTFEEVSSGSARVRGISDDGRIVLFGTYVADRQLKTIASFISSYNGKPLTEPIYRTRISGDGRFIVFDSREQNLSPGDNDSNLDVFLVNNPILDECPDDGLKSSPGICGCGVLDVDTDLDDALDCNEECDHDPNKQTPGICGCGTLDIDSDGDGTSDCIDECPNNENKTEKDDNGCDDDEKRGVTICHFPPGNPGNAKTLVVSESAVKAHLSHGDTLEECDIVPLAFARPDTLPATPTVKPKTRRLVIRMQKFKNQVTYNLYLSRGKRKTVLHTEKPYARLRYSRKGTWSYSYSVSDSSGAELITTLTSLPTKVSMKKLRKKRN